MAQIINQPKSLGTALLEGLSIGINGVLDSKMNQLRQRNLGGALKTVMPGYQDEQYQQLAQLPESTLNSFITQNLKNNQAQLKAQQNQQIYNQLDAYYRNQQGQAAVAAPIAPVGTLGLQASNQTQPSRPPMAVPIGSDPIRFFETVRGIDTDAEKMKLKREDIDSRKKADQQKLIRQDYGQKINKIVNSEKPAKEELALANEALALLKTGNIPVGADPISKASYYLSKKSGNPDLERYENIIENLVLKGLNKVPGRPGEAIADRIAAAKLQVGTSAEAQEKWLRNAMSDAKESVYEAFAYNDIVEKYGSDLPSNFGNKLNKLVNEYKTMPKEVLNLGPAQPGTLVEHNGKNYLFKDNRWKPVGRAI